ncbi:MAG: pectinesterase family protein [Planctomycetaceae bacterium]|nr:pectinesterase family protein [Planctomycetaceae bacterium]
MAARAIMLLLISVVAAGCGPERQPLANPLQVGRVLYVSNGAHRTEFRTIQAAVNAADPKIEGWTQILVLPGIYDETVVIGPDKARIILTGHNRAGTVLMRSKLANEDGPPHGEIPLTVRGRDILIRNIRLWNAARPEGTRHETALKLAGDRIIVQNVEIKGNRDALVAEGPGRVFITLSTIEGQHDLASAGGGVITLTTLRALDVPKEGGYMLHAGRAQRSWLPAPLGQAATAPDSAGQAATTQPAAPCPLIVRNCVFTGDAEASRLTALDLADAAVVYAVSNNFESGIGVKIAAASLAGNAALLPFDNRAGKDKLQWPATPPGRIVQPQQKTLQEMLNWDAEAIMRAFD